MNVVMLKLDRIRREFDGTAAVDDLSLEIRKGEFIALMGPSGCGKTTTVRLIAGLERPTSGTIDLWGRRINDLDPWDRDAPLVWQNYALFPFLSVRRNVEFGLKQRRVPAEARRAKAEDWMKRLGIDALAERSIAGLSGGQKQRVGIARALATEPEMLLLDEPLNALDPHLRVRMQAELVDLHRRLGITFVYITHSKSEAFAMADRVVVMNAGRIEQIGAPRDIYRKPATRFVAEFLGGNNVLDGTIVAVEGGRARLETALGPIEVDASGPLGARVTLVIPADLIALGPADGPSPGMNCVAAKVRTLELAGSSITVFLTTERGSDLSVQVALHSLERVPLDVGAHVTARWPASHGLILPPPTLSGAA